MMVVGVFQSQDYPLLHRDSGQIEVGIALPRDWHVIFHIKELITDWNRDWLDAVSEHGSLSSYL